MLKNKSEIIKIDPKLKEKYDKSVNKTPDWVVIDDDGKPKINISKLGKTVLEKHNCIIAENGNKEDFYEYKENLGYWELKNIKSIKSSITSILNKHHMWTDRVARDAFHFVSDSIKRVKWSETFGKKPGNYFNFKNGVWDWDAFKLQEHSPKYYFTSCVDYDLVTFDVEKELINIKNKTAPQLESSKWLWKSLGENITPIMEFIGYAFYPSYEPIQAFIMIISSGGDGKTTFANYLQRLLGKENVAHVSLENLTDDMSNNFSLSELAGKYLNIHDDISKSFIKNPAAIKNLTGGGEMNAPVKNKSDITFSNHAKLLFIGNEEPSFSDTSNGFKRRANIVHFNRIENFDQVIDTKKIEKERGKFVYLCIYLAKKAIANHTLTQTVLITKTRNKWLTDNDQVQQFIDDNYIQVEGKNVNQSSLYQAYKSWCEDNGIKHPLTLIKLKNELERKGIIRYSKQLRLSNGKRPRVYYFKDIEAK